MYDQQEAVRTFVLSGIFRVIISDRNLCMPKTTAEKMQQASPMLGTVLSVVRRPTPSIARAALNHVILLTLVPERPTMIGTPMTVKAPARAPWEAVVCVSPNAWATYPPADSSKRLQIRQ